MQIRRAYGFAFQDPSWRPKLVRASALVLASWIVPGVGSVFLTGWTALVVRKVVAGHDEELPELGSRRLGQLVMAGFRPWLVQTVWTTPILIVVAAVWLGRLALLLLFDRSDPTVIALWLASTVLTVLFGGAASIFAQAAVLRAEITDDLRAGFDLRAIAGFVRVMWWECAKDIVLSSPLNGLVVLLGLVPCGLGLLPALALTSLANAHLRAQLYRQWRDRGGAEWPLAPVDGPRISLPMMARPAALPVAAPAHAVGVDVPPVGATAPLDLD